jgi:hypothetical protein
LVPIKPDQVLAIAYWANPAKIGFQTGEIKRFKMSSDLGHNLSFGYC